MPPMIAPTDPSHFHALLLRFGHPTTLVKK
jgi:hypothetical protein